EQFLGKFDGIPNPRRFDKNMKKINVLSVLRGRVIGFILPGSKLAKLRGFLGYSVESGNIAVDVLIFLFILIVGIFILVKLGITLQSIIGEFRKFFGGG
ncbi:MAG: hypothetical protein QXZ17_14615, partial [Nitrososphaerota archaeon]